MKKIILTLTFVGLSLSLTATQIEEDTVVPEANDDIRLIGNNEIPLDKALSFAKKIANDYLKPVGFSLKTLPPKLRTLINNALSNAYLFFESQAKLRGKNKYVNKNKIKEEILTHVKSIITHLSSTVTMCNIDNKIDECIDEQCKAKAIDCQSIPETMKAEFLARKDVIKQEALQHLENASNKQISTQELYTIIHQKLNSFIERLEYALLWPWADVQLEEITRKNETRIMDNPSSHIPDNKEANQILEKSWFIRKRNVTA